MNFGNQKLEKSRNSDHGSTSIDWVARARRLVPVIAAAADRIESNRNAESQPT